MLSIQLHFHTMHYFGIYSYNILLVTELVAHALQTKQSLIQ